MIKEIIKEEAFLQIPSTSACTEDKQIAIDLVDTLRFHKEGCLGLAANMIGVSKTILAFYDGDKIIVMYNPEILKKDRKYSTQEGCLSLLGQREAIRYESIKVSYFNESFQKRIMTFKDLPAQIIQHEMDHFQGIII